MLTELVQKGRGRKKFSRKSTYPPPADGVCVLFLCKVRSNASTAAAHARRGACRQAGHCTHCKGFQSNAKALHSQPGRLQNGLSRSTPAYGGENWKVQQIKGFWFSVWSKKRCAVVTWSCSQQQAKPLWNVAFRSAQPQKTFALIEQRRAVIKYDEYCLYIQ